MRWVSRLTTITITTAAVIGAVVVIALVARPSTVTGGFRTSALFREASGLPVGSRVVIAGVTVGHIDRLTVEGNRARVGMRLRDDVVVWDDAWATKKASSALGDNYIEVSPGGPDPDDPLDTRPRRRLRSGEPIPRVIEATSTDRVMRTVEKAMPRLDDGMAAANAFLDEGREWVSGEFAQRVVELDRQLADPNYAEPLHRVHRAVIDFDERLAEGGATVSRNAPKVDRALDELPGQIDKVRGDMRAAQADLADGLGTARKRMDEADPYIERAAAFVATLGEGPPEEQGTLARMIHDPEPGDQIAAAVEGVKDFATTTDRLKTTIGFRSEVNLLSVQPRFYVTAEIAARHDQFYLIEAEKGPTGDNPDIVLTDRPGTPEWIRTSVIRERLRFTAQWGKRFGPAAVRLGIKESNFGIGVDALLLGGRLKLSADAMESSFSRAPRIKLAAALAVFRSLYVLGGVDDALTDGDYLPIQPVDEDVPTQFNEVRYGRDYFLGFELKFTDADINRMLLIYGAVIAFLLT